MDLFSRFTGKDSASKNVAKERLRLVLVHDRSSVSPQLLDSIKEEMINVISNYMEIDMKGIEVNINHDDKSVALVANIPIVKINRLPASNRF